MVDLNADLGESFGAYTLGMDDAVLDGITSANIACGWHAGDACVMARTVRLAAEKGVAVGAHPGLPDLQGFGRRTMKITPEEGRAFVQYQVGALWAFCRAEGIRLQHVKLHGALYNMAAADEALSLAICEGLLAIDEELIFLGLAGSRMLAAAEKCRLRCASEVFADRAYLHDGSLAPRSMPGAVIHDEKQALARVLQMVREGKVRSVEDTDVTIRADSICVHGDNPQAVQFVQEIRAAMAAEGIAVSPLREREANPASHSAFLAETETGEKGRIRGK